MDAAIIRIRSESHPERVYEIRELNGRLQCQCPAAFYGRRDCKHLKAVRAMREAGLVSAKSGFF